MEHTHAINVDLEQTTRGENTYTCTDCGQSITLVWEGNQNGEIFTPTMWGLRHEDEHENPIGKIKITYVTKA